MLLISACSFFAENIISGQIKDSKGNGVAYVNIGFVETSVGTVSNMDGSFSFTANEKIWASKILRFSCIGYTTVDVKIENEEQLKNVEIEMKKEVYALKELIIKPTKTVSKQYGNHSEKTFMKTNLAISKEPNMNLGAQIGRKFWFNNKAHFIKSVKFHLAYNNYDTALFRINFYDLSWGKPNKIINEKSIYKELVGFKKGWVEVDLSDHDVVLSGNVAVAIEWIGASKKGNFLSLNISVPAPMQTHFYKFGAQNRWKIFRNMSTSIVVDAEVALE